MRHEHARFTETYKQWCCYLNSSREPTRFSHSVVSDSVTPWTAAHQVSLSITNSQSLLKLMFIELVMPSNHLILCHPLLFLPSIFPSIRGFSSESVLHIRWPKDWSFSFNISPSNEHSGLISFRIDCFDLLAVQGTLSRVFSSPTVQKHQFFCMVQLSHSYMLLLPLLSRFSHVWLFATPCTAAHQASLSFTISWSFFKLMSIALVMPSNQLSLCCPLLFLPSVFPSIRIFSNELALHTKWPNYWSFSFSISPPNEYSELISFRIDWLDLLAVQGTLSRVFSSITVQKHQFFGALPSLWSSSHIQTWLLDKPNVWLYGSLVAK